MTNVYFCKHIEIECLVDYYLLRIMRSVLDAKIKVVMHVEIFNVLLQLQNMHNYKLKNKTKPVGYVNSKNNRYVIGSDILKI